MQRIAIIGSGDLGRQIAYHAVATGKYVLAGFFDDFEKPDTPKHQSSVLGAIQDVDRLFSENRFDVLMVGIGYKHMSIRANVFERYKGKIPFATIIHPNSYVDPSCRVGEGVIIYPGCVIDCHCHISDNVLLYTGCTISHEVEIGAHTMFAPGIKTSGFVKVGKQVVLGTGTVICDNVSIASNVRTGAGSVVVGDLLQPGLYYGVPAKLKEQKNDSV